MSTSPLTTSNNNTWSTVLGWLLLLLITLGAVFRVIWANPLSVDSYTHFAVGEYILANRQVPTHRDLSFKQTDPSLEWVSHSWLSDVILYISHSVSSQFGIIVLLVPLFIISAYFGYLLLPKPRHTVTHAFLLSVAMIIAVGYWRYHPFIFMVPLQLSLMLVIRAWRGGNTKILKLVPGIFLLWANLAGGHIVIPSLYLVLVFISLFIEQRTVNTSRYTPRIFSLAVSLMVGILVSFINPSGARIWVYSLTVLAVINQNRAVSSLMGALVTYNQSYNHQIFSSLFLMMFAAYTILLIGILLHLLLRTWRDTLTPFLQFIPAIAIMILAYTWVRFIPLAIFCLLPLSSWSTHMWIHTYEKHRNALWIRVGTILILSGYLVCIASIIREPPNLPAPRTMQAISSRINELNIPENILTTYDSTGYIMYANPQYKTLLDAQDDLLDDGSLISMYQPVGNFAAAFQNIAKTQSIHTAIISRSIGGLTQTLARDPQWALIYFDNDGSIFVHRPVANQSTLITHELHTVQLDRNLGFDAEHATESATELAAFTNTYPDNYYAIGQLATIYRIQKRIDLASQTLARIPKNQWDYTIYTESGRILAAQGRCKASEQDLLKALTFRNEKNFSRTVLDLAVLYAGCLKDTKKAKHYFQRYNSFLITSQEREKLHTLSKEFGIDFAD